MIWSNILELLINFKLEFTTLAWSMTPFGPYGFYKQVNNLGQLEFKSLKIASINNGALCYETDNEVVVFIGNTLPPNSNNDIYLADTPEDVADIPTAGLNAGDLVYIISTESYQSWDGDSWEDYTPGEPLIPPLADVLDQGNTSGLNDIVFDEFYGLQFNNNSRLREGTIDAGLGGNKGIAQICGAGYELKWEAGRLYVMGSSGNTIRQSLYNFTTAPTSSDDFNLGYAVGSLWTLDDGTTYVCTDPGTIGGDADWIIQNNQTFTKDSNDNVFYNGMESQVTLGTNCRKNIFYKSQGNITLGNDAYGNIFEPTENTANFIFGANLRNVTIKAGNNFTLNVSGALNMTSGSYAFLYNQDYSSEIFIGSDSIPYHKYYEGANDRYVLTNLINFDVAYIGGSSGSGIPKATASGTDTYTATISGVASYTDGDTYLIRFTNGNTTGATLNINSLGAKTLYRNNDGAIIGGDFWDGGEMLCVYNSTLNGFQCIGTSPNSIFAYVTNADSVSITKGQVVYAFGGVGDRMTVKLANNSTDATSARTVGVVFSASIGANQKGIIILQGLIDGLSILGSPFVDGDSVYLGSTNGSITRTKQYAPNHLVYIGTVTTASAGSAGRMYVKIQNGYEMDELHNVSAQTPSNKDGLFYNTTTNLWESRQVAATDINANVSNTEFGYLDGVTGAIQTQLDAKEDKIKTFNRQADSYTLVLADAGKVVEMNKATANTLTIPPGSGVGSVAFSTGTIINVVQYGGGQTTISGPGVNLRSSGNFLKLAAQYSFCTLLKIDTNEWYVFGQLAP